MQDAAVYGRSVTEVWIDEAQNINFRAHVAQEDNDMNEVQRIRPVSCGIAAPNEEGVFEPVGLPPLTLTFREMSEDVSANLHDLSHTVIWCLSPEKIGTHLLLSRQGRRDQDFATWFKRVRTH